MGGPNAALGTAGYDRSEGTASADRLNGHSGRDKPGDRTGDDTLAGGGATDRLHGNTGRDLLAGGEGRNVLIGGNHADTLAGGQGEDVFRYGKASQGGDLLLDFAIGTYAFEVSAGGFGGGLSEGIDLGATGRFAANAAGTTTSAAGVGQFVFHTDDARLLWGAGGAGRGADRHVGRRRGDRHGGPARHRVKTDNHRRESTP